MRPMGWRNLFRANLSGSLLSASARKRLYEVCPNIRCRCFFLTMLGVLLNQIKIASRVFDHQRIHVRLIVLESKLAVI